MRIIQIYAKIFKKIINYFYGFQIYIREIYVKLFTNIIKLFINYSHTKKLAATGLYSAWYRKYDTSGVAWPCVNSRVSIVRAPKQHGRWIRKTATGTYVHVSSVSTQHSTYAGLEIG